MSGPRILAIMGSGETAPTMAKVHRALFERFGPGPVPAAILDTPYGFQENADDLSLRTVRFFAESVGRDVNVASYRSRDVDALTAATALARVREARYLMAGPGSPSYALRQWADGPIPAALADLLRDGGILTMASAAALTLGAVTIPVYEIYKVGASPSWLPGLDLLAAATGLRAAVVPHYDNAEGGNHDTRFCYMGERRLRDLEGQLPPGPRPRDRRGCRPGRGHRPRGRPEQRHPQRQRREHRRPGSRRARAGNRRAGSHRHGARRGGLRPGGSRRGVGSRRR